MASVNKVILLGNCGRDPEVRYLPSGQAVANVSIATSSKRKDKASGETIEDTQWHRVTFYDRLAEIAGEYVKKGRPIYVEGRLKYGTYTDKTTGVEKNTVDIIAEEGLIFTTDLLNDDQPYLVETRTGKTVVSIHHISITCSYLFIGADEVGKAVGAHPEDRVVEDARRGSVHRGVRGLVVADDRATIEAERLEGVLLLLHPGGVPLRAAEPAQGGVEVHIVCLS